MLLAQNGDKWPRKGADEILPLANYVGDAPKKMDIVNSSSYMKEVFPRTNTGPKTI